VPPTVRNAGQFGSRISGVLAGRSQVLKFSTQKMDADNGNGGAFHLQAKLKTLNYFCDYYQDDQIKKDVMV
jgi:hypothetical protein